MDKKVTQLLSKVNKRDCTNVQKVLFTLLTSEPGWVSRSTIRVPSVGSRLRDLRKPEYGSFDVECLSASELGKKVSKNSSTKKPTFYRINPSSVTFNKVAQVFEGVVNTSL